ncbi:MAG: efflux transporter periplasmic adaptor subunit [Deltaproteobacteria bacterium]|nr:efflux transporter periplasmic adaptor subunit [Deltaproteobacteria bacterium]
MIKRKKIILPLGVLLVASLAAFVVMATAPEIERKSTATELPALRVTNAMPKDIRLKIRSQGTVIPRTESTLVPEVSGPVVWISPALASGGFFEPGEPLLRIDARDYQTAVAQARAEVARAEGESEHAASELRRQEGLAREKATSSSQLSAAKRAARVSSAILEAAWATLYRSERDLERCELRAPFKGRVREENVDIGQFVSRGSPIATLYSTDFAEIRLPVADQQLAFIELERLDAENETRPKVILKANFAGREQSWEGEIVRTEGEIDSRSRMLHIVARVEDPYETQRKNTDGLELSPPLAVGLFVQAEIEGALAKNILTLPRAAIRDGNQIIVVDELDRIHLRNVDILRIDQEDVLLRVPIEDGERVGTSSLQWAVDGMQVIPISEAEKSRT